MPRFAGIPVEEEKKPRFAGDPADVPRETPEFSFMEMLKNIPESASNIVGGTVEALMSPVETGKALTDVGRGAVSKVFGGVSEQTARLLEAGGMPEEQASQFIAERRPEEASIEAVGQLIKDRYGSLEAFQQTVQQDPVGALMDLSGAGMVAGGATRIPALTKAAAAIDPFNLATKGAKIATGKAIPKGYPQKKMTSAAKLTGKPEKVPQRIQTILEERLPLTQKGAEIRRGLVNDINSQIDDLMVAADKTGKKIPVNAIFSKFKELRRKVGGKKLEGKKDIAIVDSVAREFKQHMDDIGAKSFTPSELQEFKKDVWRKIDFERSQQRAIPAKEKAFKSAGIGAKEAIESVAPDVRDLNLREGRLLDVQKPYEAAIKRIAGRDIIGLGAPTKVGGGAIVGNVAGSPEVGTLAGVLAALKDNPKIKAAMAQKAFDLQKQSKLAELLNANVPLTVARQVAMQYGRENQ